MTKAVIMAGGKGTRLQSIANNIPKPMFPVLGKPILEYQVESLKKSGIKEITIIVGHLGQIIKDYFGNGWKWNVSISYITEDNPLGTAGALYYLKDKIDDDFILVFGDLILDIDWNRFMEFHKKREGWITLYGHPNAHPYDSDVIVTDPNGQVLQIESKNKERSFFYHNFVNAGVYCVNPRLLNVITKLQKMDLEKHVIAEQIKKGTVFAYKSTEYVKDMGTPDRWNAVIQDVEQGIVISRNLRNKQKAVFLDRDGTINVLKDFMNSAEDFKLIPNAAAGIRKINASKYLAIVAASQPVIRGECTLEQIHMKMETELGRQGAYIDDLFYYPHKGYETEIAERKIDCDCHKPKIGMLKAAADKYNIDLKNSWYIGDSAIDIQTGINAGMRTILVYTGEAGKDSEYLVKADYEAEDLQKAIEMMLSLEYEPLEI